MVCMDAIHSNISNTSFTLDQVHHQVEVWRSVVEAAIFQETKKPLAQRYHTAVAQLSAADRRLVEQWDETQWLEQITPETFTTYVERLRAWADSVPTLVVYVPVELPELEIGMLAAEVRAQLSGQHVLDMRIDPNVTGGCAFIHQEQYYDYSLHGRLMQQPKVLSEIFNAYVE